MAIGSWFRILINPGETFYEEEDNAGIGGIFVNIFLANIIASFVFLSVFIIPLIIFMIPNPGNILPVLDEFMTGFIVFLILIAIAVVISIILSLIELFIRSLILFSISKLLGGLGDFITQTYMMSIIQASSIIIYLLIAFPLFLIYALGDVSDILTFAEGIIEVVTLIASLIIGFYYLYITVVMLEEVHEFGALKSILTLVISIAIIVAGAIIIFISSSLTLSAIVSMIISSIQTNLPVEEFGLMGYTGPEYNFFIKYPENWMVNETSEGVIFYSGDDAALAVRVRRNVGDMSLMGVSKIMGAERIYKLQRIPHEMISQGKIKLNGREAYQIITIATIDAQKAKTKEIFIVEDGNAYAITYSAKLEPIDIYSRYESKIDECINSFATGSKVGIAQVSTTQISAPDVEIHQTVSTSDFSYELYLPKNYSLDIPYPLIICLSPGGNGKEFRDSVYPVTNEKGYILVGSNDFRNNIGSSVFLPRISGTLDDVKSKFNIDENRIYGCGFSGGGMGTYVISYFKPRYFRGLIVNSGAIHANLYNREMLEQMGVEKVVLICGKNDNVVTCEYMGNDEKWLNSAGIETRIIEFDGGHQIAPVDAYMEAINWLDNDK